MGPACSETAEVAAPITPNQAKQPLLQQRPSSDSAKSLADVFDGLAVATSDAAQPLASGAAPAQPSGGREAADPGCAPAEANDWEETDRKEPILQDNDERFCLLPIK